MNFNSINFEFFFPFFFLFACSVIGLNSAEVVYQPSVVPLKSHQSSTIVLRCRVNGNRLHEVYWFKDNQPIQLDASTEIISKSHRLTIHHPKKSHSGSYKCLARNTIGIIESDPYRIEIYEDNHSNALHTPLVCADLNTKFSSNGNILLCRRNRSSRSVSSHRKRSASAVAADEPSNHHPDALQKPNRKRISTGEGDLAVLNCDLKHLDRRSPEIGVRWKKDGKLIKQSNLNEQTDDIANVNPMENPLFRADGRIIMHSKNGSLIIAQTIPSDAGIYECSIFKNNDATQKSVQVTELTVVEKLKFAPPPTSKGLEMGTIGKIHCKVQGTPTPQIHWTKVRIKKKLN